MSFEKDQDYSPVSPPESSASSETRYRRLFETARDGILILDADSRQITDVNPFLIELLGYPHGEFIGKELWELGKTEDREAHLAAFRELQQKQYARYDDLPLVTKNGECRHVEFVNNIYQENGRRLVQCNIRDNTARKAAETELHSSEIRFQIFCETVPLGVFLADDQGKCLFSNRYLQNLTGLSFDALLGFGWATMVHPEDQKWVADEWVKCAGNGTECFQEYRFLSGGVVRWVNVRTVPVQFADAQPIKHVGIVEDITERKNSEELLRLTEAKYRNIVESLPAIVYLAEPVPPYSPIYVSPNIEIFGYSVAEWLGRPDMWITILHQEDRQHILSATENAMRGGEETDLEYRVITSDGSVRWLHDKGRFITDELGRRIYWQGVMLDITPTKELEEQLRQSQKLESVGLLAGGIAHDFNNMLTAINGYSDLSLRRISGDEPLRRNLEAIKQAGLRSASLTNQLLAFSRQQVLQPSIFKIEELVNEPVKMLERLIGEDIFLSVKIHPQSGSVKVDSGQFSQVILNLAVNARDAMPQGGTLKIEAANIFLKPDKARRQIGFLPGAYILLTVSDTGIGMSNEIKQHIFEPFFTTKKVGHGTGLGLATVYGIVKQSGGNIEVETKEGIGTTFKIYFPRVANSADATVVGRDSPEMPKGTETVLLVEDEELVRNLSTDILRACGYTVISAANGLEALKLCESGDCRFDLLFTDVVMPQMGGRELAEKLSAAIPDLPILFTSGYTDDAVVRHGVIENSTNFIQKPFTPQALAKKLKEILDKTVRAKH